jgi:protein-S-isoprenylcysteine O-methyltransferase Ste14
MSSAVENRNQLLPEWDVSPVDPLRIYLIAGIAAHKIYWEVTKRHVPPVPKAPVSLPVKIIKAAKIAVLVAICVQVLIPWTILPLSADPTLLRIMGIALFTLGLAMAITGRAQLGNSWSDIEVPGQVAKAALISHGLYRYIRHPIYTGDILLLLGLEMALNSYGLFGIFLMTPVILRQAVREEGLLISSLSGYHAYCGRTKRFLPFIV